jgi:hypothetical protein
MSAERWFRKKIQMQDARKLRSEAHLRVRRNDEVEAYLFVRFTPQFLRAYSRLWRESFLRNHPSGDSSKIGRLDEKFKS